MANIDTINKDFANLFEQGKELLTNGSSNCMNKAREKAFVQFQKLGVPTRANENYKYTNLIPAFDHPYNVNLRYMEVDVDLNDIFQCDVPELDTNMVLLTNGWYYGNNKTLTELPKGVIVCGVQEAAKKYPAIFEAHYGKYAKPADDGLVALNTALAKDGLFIYVPKGVVVEKPIQVVNLLRSDRDLLATQRNLFVIEENAQAKIIVCDHTLTHHKYLSNAVTEINVATNAVFDLYTLQNQHLNSVILNSTFIRQEKNSNVLTNTISLYGGTIRNNHHVLLDGEHCENHTFGMYLMDKDQHVDNFTSIDHAKPNCLSNEHFKGVMDGKATAAFAGRIYVRPDAQKTLAYQSNNNLLLSDDAQINTKPQLIIDADDVKCSHGATVGQMDEDALFYLRARGIDEKEARQMLMFAFAHEIIEKIRVEPLKDRIDALVDTRLRGEISKCNTCAIACKN
ncbi:Fe-S cluster assembly protein SufD [Labilibaculum filiforme]|uniref:Fe-S cluster assembly protein SufD n=1 Tax=Labilibaculum filiforme TaxID=1940526 RepID=A0A2N3HXC2_9BACT|nr:Fe-S cluster assembly protein SufD [Labilibaculum filiforme]PKQ62704.1 Fe-S cluster assembly protein SufD [Labilibaculum filiforme]